MTSDTFTGKPYTHPLSLLAGYPGSARVQVLVTLAPSGTRFIAVLTANPGTPYNWELVSPTQSCPFDRKDSSGLYHRVQIYGPTNCIDTLTPIHPVCPYTATQ